MSKLLYFEFYKISLVALVFQVYNYLSDAVVVASSLES
jgi:hypothetical protein